MKYSNYNSHSQASTTATNGGLSFTGLLQIVFITLKLCKVIDWSWFWVLFPTILGASIFALVLLTILIGYLISKAADRKREKKAEKERELRLTLEKERIAREAEQKSFEHEYTITQADLQQLEPKSLNEWFTTVYTTHHPKKFYTVEPLSNSMMIGATVNHRNYIFTLYDENLDPVCKKVLTLCAGVRIKTFGDPYRVGVLEITTTLTQGKPERIVFDKVDNDQDPDNVADIIREDKSL